LYCLGRCYEITPYPSVMWICTCLFPFPEQTNQGHAVPFKTKHRYRWCECFWSVHVLATCPRFQDKHLWPFTSLNLFCLPTTCFDLAGWSIYKSCKFGHFDDNVFGQVEFVFYCTRFLCVSTFLITHSSVHTLFSVTICLQTFAQT
jgi:hypothetical protein